MKTKSLILVAAVMGIAASAHAKEGIPGEGVRKLPPRVLEKFDKDGDGKLNQEERAAAKAKREEMMEARKKKMLERFDKDGDGKLSDEEKAAAHEARRQKMLEKFDKDGDGTLNDEEKAAMKEHRGGPHGGRGKKQGPDDGPEPEHAE